MAPYRNKQQNPLPSGFISIRDILNHKRGVGNLVNVIGVVKDFRTPAPTRGTDWKCEIRLYDGSSEEDSSESITINIFRPEEEMPNPSPGDVIVLFQAKLQSHAEALSLVTHRTTDIHLYAADQIPPPPEGAIKALRPQTRKTAQNPGQAVHAYAAILYHAIDKSSLPTEAEFQSMKAKSAGGTGKFRELKDVEDGIFVDVIAQLVRQPYDTGDRITLWISDYTENEGFFHFSMDANEFGAHPSTFSYGTGAGTGAGGDWKGPWGKRSMQVTCFDPHTSFIRERELSTGAWVMLRNLQIKYGRNAANLEGFLREDRGASSLKINITQLDVTDKETIDPRAKEALRRKREYETEKREQLQNLRNATMAGQKRKSDMAEMGLTPGDKPKKKNRNKSKAKRKDADHGDATISSSAASTTVSNTNPAVRCEYENKAISTIEDILKPVYVETDVNGEQVKLRLPFVNLNYRANVRVVNFMPPDLEDFAQPKKVTEYGVLSDYESDADSGLEGDTELDPATPRQWEWRFYLELEDANHPAPDKEEKKKTVWVAVNNLSAQCLVNLDASDLRNDEKNLDALRQRLFLLWGELEEKKSLEGEQKYQAALTSRALLDRPPLHSSDDESSVPPKQQDAGAVQISNRPFVCCIQQYGVQVPEEDALKADAGEGKRWQRMYGLFGTRVAYD